MLNEPRRRETPQDTAKTTAIVTGYLLIECLVPEPLYSPLSMAWGVAGILYVLVESIKDFRR